MTWRLKDSTSSTENSWKISRSTYRFLLGISHHLGVCLGDVFSMYGYVILMISYVSSLLKKKIWIFSGDLTWEFFQASPVAIRCWLVKWTVPVMLSQWLSKAHRQCQTSCHGAGRRMLDQMQFWRRITWHARANKGFWISSEWAFRICLVHLQIQKA